jgi:toxin ParE1/3/4
VQLRSPQGARSIRARIKAVADLLLKYPHVGLRTSDPSIRRIATFPFPFLVFYEIAGDEIVIHAVRHGARDPGGMPGAGA